MSAQYLSYNIEQMENRTNTDTFWNLYTDSYEQQLEAKLLTFLCRFLVHRNTETDSFDISNRNKQNKQRHTSYLAGDHNQTFTWDKSVDAKRRIRLCMPMDRFFFPTNINTSVCELQME